MKRELKMDVDSDLETESMIALDLDPDSDGSIRSLPIDGNSDELSDSSSTNPTDDILEHLDSSSDELDIDRNGTLPANDGNFGLNTVDDDNDNLDLSIDVDGLSTDDRTSDDMFDVLNRDPEWTQNFTDIHVKQFTGQKGSKLPPDFDVSVATPLDYFQLFFSDNIFETICKNSNNFKIFRCQQKRLIQPQYDEKFWEDTHIPEMKAFFGLSVMFGLLNQPRYRNFWSKDPFLGNIGVQRVFSLKRYTKMSEYLHVSDRESEKPRGHPDYDKLGKIRWLYEHLLHTFPLYKNCEREQVIDEQMVKFSGRASFIQYNAAKPVKRGVKIWARCDGTTSYCQEFSIYLGKESSQPSKNGPIFDIVWNLLKNIQGKNHVVYYDNYYSSIPLARYLYSKSFYVCGTIRQGRKHLPDKFKKPGKMLRGDSITFQSSRLANLSVTLWQDTRQVRFLSTCNRPGLITKCTRRVGSRRVELNTPSCAASYSRYYGSVDSYDKLLTKKLYGALGHGSCKLWKHLLWHFTNMAIGNAWILFLETSTRKRSKYYDQMAFRHELATLLIGGYSNRKKYLGLKASISSTVIENAASHELIRMPSKRPKRCIVHSKYKPNNRKKKDTVFGCYQCNSHFCRDCFRIAHCTQK